MNIDIHTTITSANNDFRLSSPITRKAAHWTEYLDDLYDHYGNLPFLHLEATYLPEYVDLMIPTILEIMKERFLDDPAMPQVLLAGMVGYLWTVNRIEDDTESVGISLRQHFLLLIDPSISRNDIILQGSLIKRFDKVCLGTATCRIVEPCLGEGTVAGGLRNPRKDSVVQRIRELMGANGVSRFGYCVLVSHAGERVTYDRLRRLIRSSGKLC